MQDSVGKRTTWSGKAAIWSFLEIEILRKIGKMVKKLKKLFSLFWNVRPPGHPYVGRILKKSLQCSTYAQFHMAIKGPIWSISVAAEYSEHKATQKQVPHSQKVWHTI